MTFSPLSRRLMPLFIAKFLLNLVFWYAIEKLFMTTIGFDYATIGLMAAVYSIVSVGMEIPSGILADRWSRKGVMVLAAISLMLSGLLGWLSYGIPLFLVAAIFWGFFDAFASGTSDSMVYDTLLEEQGNADNYEKVLGWFSAVGGVALVISAVAGGIIGDSMGLRDSFLWSVVPALMAVVFLLNFRDTKFHKELIDTHIVTHTKNTFSSVFRNPNLIWVLVSLLSMIVIGGINGEMYQTWYFALGSDTALYGIAGALILSTFGIGGVFTKFFISKRRIAIGMTVVLVSAIIIGLVRDFWTIVAAQFFIGFMSYTLMLNLTAQLHRQLPSQYRAGAGSVVNTVGRLVFSPLALLFGWLSLTSSVFTAGWLLVVLAGIGLMSEFFAKDNGINHAT